MCEYHFMNSTTTAAARWSWRQAPELMARLREAQNHPANVHQDVMTIVGFFSSTQELEQHVLRCERQAKGRYCPMCETWTKARTCKACGMATEL